MRNKLFLALILVWLASCANTNYYQKGSDNRIVAQNEAIKIKVNNPSSSYGPSRVVLINVNPFPYIVKVQTFNNSSRLDPIGESFGTIEPRSNLTLDIYPDRGKMYAQQVFASVNWKAGDGRSEKSNGGFIIPFPRQVTANICQYKDGPITTHQHNPEAVDFCVPIGTPILVSKSGIVIEAVDSNTDGGNDRSFINKSNFVKILHDDGSIARYDHLAPNSLKIKSGDYVKQGETLGAVGMTGYTSGPHLHFETWYVDSQFKTIYTSPSFVSSTKAPIRLSKNFLVTQDGPPIEETLRRPPEPTKLATQKQMSAQNIPSDRNTSEGKATISNRTTNEPKNEIADSVLFNLGNEAYRNGNYKQAYMYFSKSARAFNPAAQLNLGLLYLNGEGVTKDEASAYLWLEMASRSSIPEVRRIAGQRLFRLAGRMNNKDLVVAKDLVESCKKTKLANCGR